MLSNAFANDLLRLVFHGATIDGLAADITGGLGQLYISLHTEDPGAAGTQETSEVDYEGYTRIAIPRTADGFTIDGTVMNPTEAWEFGEMTAGDPQTATYMAIGTDETGPGKILFRAAMQPTIALAEGVTPRLRTSSTLRGLTAQD